MKISKFPTTTRACTGCGIRLRPGELTACIRCSVGHDFLSAALAYQRANPKPKRRRHALRAWR